jgi:predicted acetyltransferase
MRPHDPAQSLRSGGEMIRQATREDIMELADLWSRSFPGERTVEQRARQLETGGVFGGIDTAYLSVRDGRVMGAFRAYALNQYMHETQYRMLGLAAVAVDETMRRHGVGRELCEAAIGIARARGDVISALYPFRPSFYNALGWGLAGKLLSYRFRPESLVRVRNEPVRRAGSDDYPAIAACYSRVAQQSNGLIVRTPRIWRQHLEATATHIYITGDDRVRGYVVVHHGRARSPDHRPLFIHEMIAEDENTYSALLGWISAQRDMWRVVQYDATPDELFDHRLSEPRPPGYRPSRFLWNPIARVVRGPMLRVLDVRKAVEQRVRWGAASPMRFTLEISDPLVPDNEGPFELDFDGSTVRVGGGNGNRPTLSTDAATFAQIFAGELRVVEAIRLGTAVCDGDKSSIDALFCADRCFRFLDEF